MSLLIEIDEHDYQDAVNTLEELRNYWISSDLKDFKTQRELNKALKLLTGEDYEQE